MRHNTVGWEDPKEYLFRLNFTDEGQFRIIVRDADTNAVLEDWIVQDSTFTGGFFGFYNFSQAPIRYAGFTTTVVEDNRLFFTAPWDEEGLAVKDGSIQIVEWGDEGFITNVMLEYTANGSDWETIEASTVNDGAYEWTVPEVTSDMCQLRVSDVDAAEVFAVIEMFTIFECTRLLVADLNDDCYVNLLDLAIMAGEWLECGYPFDSECD